MSRADVGLVVLADRPGAEAIYTSKLFEYLGMGIPILLVGPDRGVAANLVREARAGVVVPYDRPDLIAEEIERMAVAKTLGRKSEGPEAAVVARYTRQAQTAKVAAVLAEAAQVVDV
ncbi:MAG: hypothetical protein U1E29_08855 [Coriobacteriia bacterium]|nr:hypothetical protein [Coriobacteriia bacterium]